VRRLALIALAACGGGEDFHFGGATGVPIAADFAGWVPVVDGAAGGRAGRFLVDTGAPFSALDAAAFALPAGSRAVDLEALGLRLGDYPVEVFDLFPGADGAPTGLLGADLLGHFAVDLDYRRGEIVLDGPARPAAVDSDCALVGTRLLARARIDDQRVYALVDSGAGFVWVNDRVIDRLAPAERPRLDGVTVATADGPRAAYLTRVSRFGVEPGVEIAGQPVLVTPGVDLLAGLADEVDRPVDALIGGPFLRWYVATLDYPTASLELAAYPDPSHIDPDEWIAVGFTLVVVDGTWRVGDVYAGTDAEAEGLRPGDPVAELAGMATDGLARADLDEILAAYPLGDQVAVGLRRGEDVDTVEVAVEDLLPSYEGP
jgi:hypothetical protein